MCINKQDSEYAWGPEYVQGSAYAKITQGSNQNMAGYVYIGCEYP